MKLLKPIVIFLVINFGALAIGSLLMGNGPQTDWYSNLNKAPWTPPGWVFGAAWTFIMICFSIYLAYVYTQYKTLEFKILFTIQVMLNISWNYLFFNLHLVTSSLLVISLLTILIIYFFFNISVKPKALKALLLPYIIWLCIATSLNLYVVIYN